MTSPSSPARWTRRARAGLVLLGSLAIVGCAPRGAPTRAPNLIVVSIDTLRRDHVGHYGYARPTTPNLDELAKESVTYDRAYTTWTWTLPAHMSLLTGLHPSQHGVWRVGASLQAAVPTLAERLSARGYYGVGLHFPGWLDPDYGFGRGFDVYRAHRDAEEATAHLEDALAERPADRPLFLFVHLFDVHNAPLPRAGPPYDPPAPFDEAFLAGARARLSTLDARQMWKVDGAGVTDEEHEAIVALYDGGIRYVDEVLGRWVEGWRASGLLDRSLLLVTADHGEGLRQRGGRYGGHGEGYEEGLRVPLLLRYPGGRFGGESVVHPVSHVDVVPTLLEELGLPADARLPGRHLNDEQREARLVVAENPRTEAEVVIGWPLKVVRVSRPAQLRFVDLRADPREQSSIDAADDPDGFARLAAPLLERLERERATWFRAAAGGGSPEAEPGLSPELEALGYGGD